VLREQSSEIVILFPMTRHVVARWSAFVKLPRRYAADCNAKNSPENERIGAASDHAPVARLAASTYIIGSRPARLYRSCDWIPGVG